ncbi:MAG: hypothetical protein R8M45_03890 [Ghiorsea sp.]
MPINPNIADLDYAKIKQNIIAKFKTDPNLVDLNYEGSTVTSLVNVMSYFTHYQAVYANMAYGERFLDSAKLRDSVVSRAKELGYTPSRSLSAIATVSISIPIAAVIGTPASITMPNGTVFTGTNSAGTSLKFITAVDHILTNDGVNYTGNVIILEGTSQLFRWAYNATTAPTYTIHNRNIDTNTLSIKVKQSAGNLDSTGTSWNIAGAYTSLTALSQVFFFEEGKKGAISVYFGDGIQGSLPIDGNEILVDYITTSGIIGNGCGSFALSAGFAGISINSISVATISMSGGGSEVETIESIKMNAPLSRQAQDRAVTANDYVGLLKSRFPWIQSINVWGGEENIPPAYGRVFVCVKPTYADIVTTTNQNEMILYLSSKKVIGILPLLVTPRKISVDTTSVVNIDSTKTTLSTIGVRDIINLSIQNYMTTNIFDFNQNIRYSRLLDTIDKSELSILSNETTIALSYAHKFVPNLPINTAVLFSNQIKPNTFITDTFGTDLVTRYHLSDDGSGNVDLYMNNAKVAGSTHTIDYLTGTINLVAFDPVIQPNDIITFRANPVSNDVKSSFDVLLSGGTQNTSVIAVI